MLKQISISILIVTSAVLMSSCRLDTPPECTSNQVICTNATEGSGQVFKVCGHNVGNWSNYVSCNTCSEDGKTCLSGIPKWTSNNSICITTDSENDISLGDVNGLTVPTVCDGKCVNGECLKVYDDSCPADAHYCVDFSQIGVEISCVGGRWKSMFCQNGSCDPETKQCTSAVSCDEENAPCEGRNTWISGICKNNRCIPNECVVGYESDGEDCVIQTIGCVSNGLACCAERPTLDVVHDTSEECHYTCKEGYLDCDGDDSVCEINTQNQHYDSCGVCSEGYLDCDPDLPGCETNMAEEHKTGCDTCEPGYCLNGNKCADSQYTASACGLDCFDCNTYDHALSGVCNNSQCISTMCEPGYSINGVKCCENVPNATVINDAETECHYTCLGGFTHNGKQCCANILHGTITEDSADECHFTCTESGYQMNRLGTGCESTTCTENETNCINNTERKGLISVCHDNSWQDDSTCSYSCAADGKTCGQCIEGTIRCTDVDGTGQKELCQNGEWTFVSVCSGASSCDVNQVECGICKNDDTRCVNNATTGRGSIETCQNGEWKQTDICDNGVSCDISMKSCGSCTSSEKKCTNAGDIGSIQTCESGNWGSAVPCGTGYSCKSSTECGECKNHSKRCSGTTAYQICNSGTWGTKSTCEAPSNGTASCSDGSCDFACGSGYCKYDGRCVDKNTDMNNCGVCGNACNTDKVPNSTGVICTGGNCKATGCINNYTLVSGVCQFENCPEGETRCSNNSSSIGKIEECVDNMWVEKNSCNNVSCDNTNTNCGQCKNYTSQCVNNGTTGQMQSCQNGVWHTDNSCNNNYSCEGNTKCGECVNGTTVCVNNGPNVADTLKTCSNGKYTTETCPTSVMTNSDHGLGACSSSTACGSYKCVTNFCPYSPISNVRVCSGNTNVNACGTSCINCSTTNTIPSGATHACISGACSFTCPSGKHKSGSNCVADTNTACGSDTNNCNNLINTNGISTITCSNGECVVTSCLNGYNKVTNTYNGKTKTVCLSTCNSGNVSSYTQCSTSYPDFDTHTRCSPGSACNALISGYAGPCCYY